MPEKKKQYFTRHTGLGRVFTGVDLFEAKRSVAHTRLGRDIRDADLHCVL